MALTKLNNQSLSAVTANGIPTLASSNMPTGSVLQVIGLEDTTEGGTTSSTYSECSTNYRPAITPKSSSNKVLASFEMNIWGDMDNDTQGTIAGQIKIDMYIDGVFNSKVYETNTNNIARGGQHRMMTISVTKLLTPSTTSEVSFRVSFRRNSGSRTIKFNTGSFSRAVLTEIAG